MAGHLQQIHLQLPRHLACALTCCRKVVKEVGARSGIAVLHAIQVEGRLGVDGVAGHPIGQIVLGIAVDLVLLAIRQAARWLHTCIINEMN